MLWKKVEPDKNGWLDLKPYWEEIEQLGQERLEYRTKLSRKNERRWNMGANTAGIAGEWAFGLLTGIAPDLALKRGGDGGVDFEKDGKTIDVKTHTNLKHVRLIIETKDSYIARMKRDKKWADQYVLVLLDVNNKKAKVMGYIDYSDLEYCPVETFNIRGDIHDNFVIYPNDLKEII